MKGIVQNIPQKVYMASRQASQNVKNLSSLCIFIMCFDSEQMSIRV